jgi:hypothetical protein
MDYYSKILIISLIKIVLSTSRRQYNSHKIDNSNVYRYEPVILVEEPPIGTLVVDLSQRLGLNLDTSDYKFRFYSPSSTISNYFLVDQLTGHVKTQRNIDREFLCDARICGPCSLANCSLTVEVVASSPPSANSISKQKFVSFNIIIEDKNEFAPTFPKSYFTLNITENTPPGFIIPLEPARDKDSKKTLVSYSVAPVNYDPEIGFINETEIQRLNSKIRIQTSPQLSLVIIEPFDYEIEKELRFKIKASDNGWPVLSDYCLVTLKVTDINDNLPVFDRIDYEYKIDENTRPDTRLIRVHASDADDGLNGLVSYSLDLDSSIDDFFTIDEKTGWISTRSILDYEYQRVYRFSVKARDHGVNSMPVYASVTIFLNDLNDNAPNISLSIPEDIYMFNDGKMYVSEWTNSGAFLSQITVTDLDSGVNGQVKLEIEPNDEYFGLENLFGNIYSLILKKEMDREKHSMFKIALRASDFGTPILTSSLVLEIHVLDENDNVPKFRQNEYHYSIEESNQISNKEKNIVILGRLEADDKDFGDNGRVLFEILNQTKGLPFKINSLTGDLSVNLWMLDREKISSYEFKVICIDNGRPQLQSEANVFVKILDINDNEPKFSQKPLVFDIYEDLALYSKFGRVNASDADEPNSFNSTVQYIIIDDDNVFFTRIFSLNVDTGDFYLVGKIDYEEHPFYEFQIMAYDLGTPRLASKTNVRINIIDVNDNRPQIISPNKKEFPLVFNKSQTGDLFQIKAYDADSYDNSKLKYEIRKQFKFDYLFEEPIEIDFFTIDLFSGTISIQVSHDGIFCIDVQVTDSSRTNPLSVTSKIFIVINKNLSEDILFLRDFFNANLSLDDKRVINLKNFISGKSNEALDDDFESHSGFLVKKSRFTEDFFGKNYKLVLVLIFFASIMMLCIIISIFVMILYRRQKALIIKKQNKLITESNDERTNLYVNDLNKQRRFVDEYQTEYGKIRTQAMMNIDLNLNSSEDQTTLIRRAANSPASSNVSSSNNSSTDASNQTESSILLGVSNKKHDVDSDSNIYDSSTFRTFKTGSYRIKDDDYARIQQAKIKRNDSHNKYSTLPFKNHDDTSIMSERKTSISSLSIGDSSNEITHTNKIPNFFFKDENEFKKLMNKQKINCKHVIISEDSAITTTSIPNNGSFL